MKWMIQVFSDPLFEASCDTAGDAISCYDDYPDHDRTILYDDGAGYGWRTFRHSAEGVDEAREAAILS